MSKKIYLRTFGCQMNVRDSEFVTGVLLGSGFQKASSEDKADVIIFNSCSVRKHAEDRLFSNISELKNLKKKKPGLIIGLMGCTAQAYKEKAIGRAPIIDFVCGPGNVHEIPAIIKKVAKSHRAIVATDKVDSPRPELFPKFRIEGLLAYVSISEGCNNYCSYCIVPYVRGRERSRDTTDIIKEVKDLASRGFKEIMLLGQNVNSYKYGFIQLLEKLNNVEGIEKIRFMTSHPKDVSRELFEAMHDLEKIDKRLHLPVQSGSDRILKLMNRGYTKDHYRKLVSMYKKLVPGGEITTDIIVGFPRETERDFKDTVRLVEKTQFDGAYIFKYSPRPPARSCKLKDDVPPEEKQRRLAVILDIQREMSRKKRRCV
ncbi:MAG: tRNA (N6-isopentenyl adenosine(37)-C2)-methylthiotransferase MiaB [Candidatus Omnitrophica bacterium]|nr:tRNA (N6-isopentenyl adenosine(37)-C2)-methylthiotransferase MiaB [Candidatus Omnitrophota bacterium]